MRLRRQKTEGRKQKVVSVQLSVIISPEQREDACGPMFVVHSSVIGFRRLAFVKYRGRVCEQVAKRCRLPILRVRYCVP
jgi:hypothetical protein